MKLRAVLPPFLVLMTSVSAPAYGPSVKLGRRKCYGHYCP
jgi:hypothetical protein